MFLRSMDMTDILRLGGSTFTGRGVCPIMEGSEKNLECPLRGVAVSALLPASFKVKDNGAGKTSSRPPCCAEFRYRNDGSSSSSLTDDEALCIRACKSRIKREWAWHRMTSLCILPSRTAAAAELEDDDVARARVG